MIDTHTHKEVSVTSVERDQALQTVVRYRTDELPALQRDASSLSA